MARRWSTVMEQVKRREGAEQRIAALKNQLIEAQQVVAGQCGTCGVHSEGPDAKKSPEDMYQFWFRRVVSPPGLEGVTLVCDDCKAFVMMALMHMPDRGPAKLKGYT